MAEEINQDWIKDTLEQDRTKSESPKSKYPSVSADMDYNYNEYNQSLCIQDDGFGSKGRSYNVYDQEPTINTHLVNMSKLSSQGLNQSKQEQYQDEEQLIPTMLPGRSVSSESEPTPSQEEIKKYNLSIMTEKVKKFPIQPISKSQAQNKNLQESYYMKPDKVVEDKQVKIRSAKKIDEKPKVKMPSQPIRIESQEQISVIFRSTSYFLEGNKCSIQVDSTSLHDMCDEFFRLEVFIPLFNYELFDGWMLSPNKYELNQQSHKLFRIYLQRYTTYLNDHCQKQFQQVLNSLLEIQQGKNTKKVQNSTLTSIFSFDFYSILERIMKIVRSSKTQFLRDSLMAKARSLREANKYCEQGGQKIKHYLARLQDIEEATWRDVGEIQLLLSLQSTEVYCCKKIEDSIQPKFKDIYSKYRDCMRIQKKKHLNSLNELML